MINTQYPESVEESGRYLRTALQKINATKLAYNPISYLMWYEYATGRNQQLIRDMELLLKKKPPLHFDIISSLYQKYMLDSKALLAEQKSLEFQKILTEMTRQLSEAGSGFESHGNKLDIYATKLGNVNSLKDITEVANSIVAETRSVVESTKTLKIQLDETKTEINELNKELEGIKKTAKTDMLTSLLNRHGFDHYIAKVLGNKDVSYEPLCVIMVDIDYFKKVNDTYGHLVGDSVLKMLGHLFNNLIKGQDIAARFGGEEFIIVLPQTPIDGAFALAEKIRLSFSTMKLKVKETGESIGEISISLGIALLRKNEHFEAAIQRADNALYHAKKTGRNKTVLESDCEN